MMVQDEKLRGTKVFTTHLWGGRDYSCWDIKKQKFQPIENNQWITKLNRIILLGTVSNFMAAHQVVVEIFQSGPKWLTAQPTLPPRATSMKSNRCCFLTSHKCRSSQQINKPQKVVKVYSRVGPHQTSAPTTAHASVPKNKRKGGGETLHGWDLSMLAGTHTDQQKHFSAASDKPLNISRVHSAGEDEVVHPPPNLHSNYPVWHKMTDSWTCYYLTFSSPRHLLWTILTTHSRVFSSTLVTCRVGTTQAKPQREKHTDVSSFQN